MRAPNDLPSDPPVISVVIAHLNQPEMLARCLTSLMAGNRLPDEILVVDNGSSLPPQDICDAFPHVRLLHEATPGPGPARTTGAIAARGEIIAFVDADCIVDRNWLVAAEAAMADPAVDILGGDVRIAYADPNRLSMLEAYESIYGFRVADYIARENFTVTCNLVTRPAVMDSVGPFAGLAVAEDIDWGHRATDMGFKIHYRPEMLVCHPARPDLRALRIKWDRHMAHFYHDIRDTARGRAVWALKTVAMVFSPLSELVRILRSDRVSGLRNRGLAFQALVRIRFYRARMMAWLLMGGDPAVLAGRWNRPPTPTTPG